MDCKNFRLPWGAIGLLIAVSSWGCGKSDPAGSPAAADNPPAVGDRPVATDELLGFSRYLPADTDGYLSILQAGRTVRTVAGSQAWGKIEQVPEVARMLAELRTVLESEKIPPQARTGLELLASAADAEITFATSPEVSQNLLAVARVALLSVAVLAPSPHAPESPQGRALEEKRESLKKEWLAALPAVRIPSFSVVAARVRDQAKFAGFVETMLDLGWQSLLAEVRTGAPPEFLAAYTPVTIGDVRLRRFRLRIGDVVPPQALAGGLRELPLDEGQRAAIVRALGELTVDVHLGFVGEYLTLAVSSDDQFIRRIVERYQGKSQATLAASSGFESVRKRMSSAAVGIVYTDSRAVQEEYRRTLFPLLTSLTDPSFLDLLGAPPQVKRTIANVKSNLETQAQVMPVRQASVLTLERGLRQAALLEFEREPLPAPTDPLRTPRFVPENAVGYSAWRSFSLDGVGPQIRFMIEQARRQGGEMTGNDPNARELRRFEEQQIDRFLGIITAAEQRLEPSLRGELGVVAGGFTPLAVKEVPVEIRDIPIPTLALLVHSPDADEAIGGLRELFQNLVAWQRSSPNDAPSVPPLTLDKHDLDGLETWRLAIPGLAVEGFEPHLVRVGDALVLSSSFALTRQLRDTSAGKTPDITGTAGRRGMREFLSAAAYQQLFLDGEVLNRSVRSTAKGVFGMLVKNREAFRISPRDLIKLTLVKSYVDLGIDAARCFRAAASSMSADGRFDELREWVHLEDVGP